MKVSELFEAQGEPGQKGKLQGGAYYPPTFKPAKSDSGLGDIRGSVKDWLDLGGVSKTDIADALANVKKSKLFKTDFPAAGLEYERKEVGEKNGTLVFKVNRVYPNGYRARTGYIIYANGQIRSTSGDNAGEGFMGPLKSPKPRMRIGDPAGSVESTILSAMEELLNKWNKAVVSMDKLQKARVAKAK